MRLASRHVTHVLVNAVDLIVDSIDDKSRIGEKKVFALNKSLIEDHEEHF